MSFSGTAAKFQIVSDTYLTATVPDGTTDIVIEIPDWNKNYAKEAEH